MTAHTINNVVSVILCLTHTRKMVVLVRSGDKGVENGQNKPPNVYSPDGGEGE